MKGIYKITNKITGVYYVGSSMNIKTRFKTHQNRLKGNTHPNRYLQSAWNKYGEDNFIFEVVQEVDVNSHKELYKIEQEYLDVISRETAYNLTYVAKGGGADTLNEACYVLDLKGNIIEEFKSRSDAARYMGFNNSSSLRKKVPSATYKKKYRVVNVDFYNENLDLIKSFRSTTREEREEIDAKEKKERRIANIVYYKGKEYSSRNELAKYLGVSHTTVSNNLNKNKEYIPFNKNNVYYEGKEYKSSTELAEYLGIGSTTVATNLNKNKEFIPKIKVRNRLKC